MWLYPPVTLIQPQADGADLQAMAEGAPGHGPVVTIT